MKCLSAIVAVLSLALPLPAAATAPDFAPLADLVRAAKEDAALPSGTAIAVVSHGKVVYEGYFGYADIAARTPVTRDTVFYIASATKPFFALNALAQAQAGRLDTRLSLQRMFPDARFAGIDADAVTLADLLVHTSGIDNAPLVWATAYSGVHDPRSLAALVAASTPDAKAARGTFRYTNVGYNIASVWLDRQFAAPWQEQLQKAIFAPLRMRHTTARVSEAPARGWPVARPYSFASERPREPLYLEKTDATMHAAGGLVSTAPDLAKFLIAQMPQRAPRRLRAAIARSHETQATLTATYNDFARSGYAWGWYAGEYKGRRMLHHFGGFAGFHAHLSFLPDDDLALVVVNNEDVLSGQVTNLVADYVYGTLLGEPDVAAKATRRFDELRTKARAQSAAAAQKRAAIAAREWQLSLPRADYAGTYANDRLGELTVALNRDGNFQLRWGRLASVATAGERRDQVRVEFVPNSGEFLDFDVAGGKVVSLAFDGMAFTRRPR